MYNNSLRFITGEGEGEGERDRVNIYIHLLNGNVWCLPFCQHQL